MLKKGIHKRLFAVSLAVLIICGNPMPLHAATFYEDYDKTTVYISETEDYIETVEIYTKEDLINLSNRCRLDINSDKLYVALKNDIFLDSAFEGIAYFNGFFEGNGYSISNLTLSNEAEPVGFFACIGEAGIVKNLTVSGTLQPTEKCDYIGGIAGENRGIVINCSFVGVVTGNNFVGGIAGLNATGAAIINCSSNGAVRGDNMTGGIAGANNGRIIGCNNYSIVNTESVESGIDIANLDIDFSFDLTKLSGNRTGTATDMGGIAGYSCGIIAECTNLSSVGYSKQGYNVGGIAGRSSGYVLSCKNEAQITGRKDIGGIVGQQEPYLKKTVSESKLYSLSNRLKEMQDLMDQTREDANNAGNSLSNRVDKVTKQVSKAESEASELSKDVLKEYDNVKNPDIKEDDIEKKLQDKINNLPDDYDEAVKKGSDKLKEPESVKKQEELSESLKNLNTQIELLNKEAKGYGNQIDEDLKAINDKYSEIEALLDEIADTDIGIKDISVTDTDLFVFGVVRKCTNTGEITGDLNVGGISGVIGEESSIDPEDEISLNIDREKHTQYEYKAVLDNDVNNGFVNAKRNYAGGIAGRAEIGYIKNCENYGDIKSDGSYAGGIAASSRITIKNSYVKATVSGKEHVGGIIGEGIGESANGAKSIVSDCRALVRIMDASKFYGAIAGSPDGEFDNNLYTEESLNGLGVYSIAGMAAPVPYEELIAGEGIPEEFKKLRLSFYADGTLLKSLEFTNRDSFNEEVFPDIPAKKGCYAKWDTTELKELTSDTKVTAVYTPFISALSSKEVRSTGRPVFYVEGDYSEEQVLDATAIKESVFELNQDAKKSISDIFYSKKVEEQWQLILPHDGRTVHTVRYLPTDISAKAPEIYVNEDGSFKIIPADAVGSFYKFETRAEKLQICVVSQRPVYSAFVILFAAIASVIVATVLLVSLVSKAKKRMAEKNASEEEAPEEAFGENEESKEAAPVIRRRFKAFKVLLSVVNLTLFAALIAFTIYLSQNPELVSSKIAYLTIMRAEADSNAHYEVSMKVTEDNEEAVSSAVINVSEEDGIRFSCVETRGVKIYKCKDKIYLENGAAFTVSDIIPKYEDVLPCVKDLLQGSNVHGERVDGGTKYFIDLNGDNVETVIGKVAGEYGSVIKNVENASVTLFAGNSRLKSIAIKAGGETTGDDRYSIDCTISVVNDENMEKAVIPKAVLDAAKENAPAPEITPEMLKLLYAFGEFYEKDKSACTVDLSANGGIISLSESLLLTRNRQKNGFINCVTKNGISLYFNENGACTGKGETLTEIQKKTIDAAGTLNLAYELLLNGEMNITKNQSITVYKLDLDTEEMSAITSVFAKDLESVEKVFTKGYIQVTLKEGKLFEVKVKTIGTAKRLFGTRAFGVQARIMPLVHDGNISYDLPAAVSETLGDK